ncbi:MAG: methionine adenosyltransferase [Deltaproteobacteria bacterium]|nr:methionine adenosyltransferase [Deltaproteobacteria bacterium]
MSLKNYLFTSESVSEGHPDKMCDQISDAILDMHLSVDPNARVACETLIKTGLIVVAGEITSKATALNYEQRIREVVNEIGYDHTSKGFDGNTCGIMVALGEQSTDIAQGVDRDKEEEQGAGDQGMMFGYACDETKEFMPFTLHYSHRLLEKYAELRKNGTLSWALPDAKSQITGEYVDGKLTRVHTVVISAQHTEEAQLEQIQADLRTQIVEAVLPADLLDENTIYHFNPTGRFVTGGPVGDCGLTGRKIIVDTYGGHGAHGGGAFSGKDPSKVDRSAAYLGRYAAKNIVAAGFATRCLVQLAYAIGVADPVSVMVDTYGTGTVSDEALAECVRQVFPCRPAKLTKELNLLRPIYRQTAAYGHFGREDSDFTWERLDRVDAIKAFFA